MTSSQVRPRSHETTQCFYIKHAATAISDLCWKADHCLEIVPWFFDQGKTKPEFQKHVKELILKADFWPDTDAAFNINRLESLVFIPQNPA